MSTDHIPEIINDDRFPYYTNGTVVKGFGRGSKKLGVPTANYGQEVINVLPENMSTGVYYGWAQVENLPVEMMVMSIGWNPFFQNTERSMEIHIIKKYDKDFYGSNLKIKILGFIRPEMNFSTLEELIKTIHADIDYAKQRLADYDKTDEYFINS